MRRDGFTFVEVLISLGICALMIGVVCSALIHVSQTEQRTRVLRGVRLHLQTLACRTYLGRTALEDVADGLPAAWRTHLDEEIVEDEATGRKTPWLRWRIAPANDPGFAYTVSLRDGQPPWQGP